MVVGGAAMRRHGRQGRADRRRRSGRGSGPGRRGWCDGDRGGRAASALFAECASRRANRVASPPVVRQLMASAPQRGAPPRRDAAWSAGRRGVAAVERERLADHPPDRLRVWSGRARRSWRRRTRSSWSLRTSSVTDSIPSPTTSEPHERDVGASCESQWRDAPRGRADARRRRRRPRQRRRRGRLRTPGSWRRCRTGTRAARPGSPRRPTRGARCATTVARTVGVATT